MTTRHKAQPNHERWMFFLFPAIFIGLFAGAIMGLVVIKTLVLPFLPI